MTIDAAKVQAIVLRTYKQMSWARFLFVKVVDPGRFARFMGEGVLASAGGSTGTPSAWSMTTIDDEATIPTRANIALTVQGLRALGVPETDIATFAPEFVEGMADPVRADAILGDVGASAPDAWELGGPRGGRIDAMLMLYGRTMEDLAALTSRAREAISSCAEVIADQLSNERSDHEHFGFRDGSSQPRIAGFGNAQSVSNRDVIEAGEVLLGYKNQYGRMPIGPSMRSGGRTIDLGANGTYLVFRKLEQDIVGFWRYFDSLDSDADKAEHLAAKCIGRYRSGTPVTLRPDPSAPDMVDGATVNDFGYADYDLRGLGCPTGAHIRRANPRDALDPSPDVSAEVVKRHRIVRRSRAYGPWQVDPRRPVDDGQHRGLYFIAINASIRRQFEFVQQTWLTNPKFGNHVNDRDVLIHGANAGGPITLPEVPFRRRLSGVPSFITTKGGGYFFVPGAEALDALGRLSS